MFQKVCGLALKNVVLVTTRWDVVGDERAVELEQGLVTGLRYFKPLCDAGATTFGHNNTCASARRIMDKLLNNNPMALQIQEELRTGMKLEQTASTAIKKPPGSSNRPTKVVRGLAALQSGTTQQSSQ
jgi:hypothetical protein